VTERSAIPQRLRFEIFKRDKFTCQYCGRSAPEVVLNCDHIQAVANGGSTDILNLVTSCRACNGGKGAIPLSDTAAIDKQKGMLEELEERRQQLEMMMQWRDGLRSLETDSVDALVDRISELSSGHLSPNENGRADLRRWFKRFTFAELLSAIDESFGTYLSFDADGEPTTDSWNKAFRKIPDTVALQRNMEERPYLKRLLYIQGIIRNRSRARRYQCVEYLEHLVICGVDIDDMERRAKRIHSLEDFEGPYDEWLKRIGRPY
jgi:hypothetical protein